MLGALNREVVVSVKSLRSTLDLLMSLAIVCTHLLRIGRPIAAKISLVAAVLP